MYTSLRANFSVVMPFCFKRHSLGWNNRSECTVFLDFIFSDYHHELLEELKYYLEVFFKYLYEDVFSKDNKTMKTE